LREIGTLTDWLAMDYSDKFNETGKEQVNSEKIFKIFHTLSPCDGVESTDIGLSIVKKLVELNNGKVWVDSKSAREAHSSSQYQSRVLILQQYQRIRTIKKMIIP